MAFIADNTSKTVSERILPVIEKMYEKIDVSVNWVEFPVERSMVELSKGNIDGAMLLPLLAKERYPDLLFLTSHPIKMNVFLVCELTLDCDKSILKSKANTLIAPSIASHMMVRKQYSAKLRQIENVNELQALITSGRFDYAITVELVDDNKASNLTQNAVLLDTLVFVHVLAANQQERLMALSKLPSIAL